MPEMNLLQHWKIVRLGDVCNIIMGQSPPSTTYNDIGMGMPFLQGKAEFTELFPAPTKYCTKQLRVSPKGSVLMSVRAPVGDVNLGDREYIIGRGLTSISLKHGNNRFLFYLLLHNKKKIEAKGYGSTFKSINKTAINDFQIALPPLPEQRAIAYALQTIQEAKAARQRELALERERKAALMDHLFSYGTKGEPRKQTEIGEIPESWKVVQIGQIADFINGYSQFNSKSYVDNGIPIFRIGDLGGQVDLSGVKRVSKDIVPDLNQKRLFRGDILIAKIGKRVGASSAYNFDEPAILSSQVAGVRARRIDQKFLGCFIESSLFYDAIKPHFFGSTRDNISPNQIGLTSIPLPSPSEQWVIAEVLQACDAKIAALEQEAARLDELFHAMLHELMTGKRSAVPLIDAELPN